MNGKVLLALVLSAAAVGAVVFLVRSPDGKQWIREVRGRTGQPLQAATASGRHGAYYLPPGYEARPLPMLVLLHGSGGSGLAMVQGFADLADEREFIIVAPDANQSASWEVGDHLGEITSDFTHTMDCIREVLALPNVQLDASRVLVAGFSAGGSSAPYYASNDPTFTAFAVMHGGIIEGGFGTHVTRGWFSTGDADTVRPTASVQAAADFMTTREHFSDVHFQVFPGGHGVFDDERQAVIAWWLGG